jgi:multidrug resistance efflux pump
VIADNDELRAQYQRLLNDLDKSPPVAPRLPDPDKHDKRREQSTGQPVQWRQALRARDARIAQLEAELAAATKDARRYRWLRERGVTWNGDTAAFWLVDSIADYEIDAAIAATQANEGGKDG